MAIKPHKPVNAKTFCAPKKSKNAPTKRDDIAIANWFSILLINSVVALIFPGINWCRKGCVIGTNKANRP